MRIRGQRRCKDCGERWSYYETGEVTCPSCGSILSVGVDDRRRLHTAGRVDFDLSGVRTGIDQRPLRDVAQDAAQQARTYVSACGFIDGGTLLPLDDVALAAAELRHAGSMLHRRLDVTEAEERYFLALLAGADAGDRPDAVPESMRSARGLGVADAVGAYRTDLSTWLELHPDPAASSTTASVRDHVKRIEALDGDVPPEQAEVLVAAARALGTYLREDDESALIEARDRVDRLG